MIKINLLPHRQIKRAERQRQFNLMLLMVFVASATIVFMGRTLISSSLDSQLNRNQRLDSAIAGLDKEISEISELKKKINEVLDRKKVVENLQTDRSQAVILLDELARKLPEGVYLRSIKQVGNLITIEGYAESNNRIATLVRNLSTSEHLDSPGLVEIKSELVNNIKRNHFVLNVSQKAPSANTEAPETKKIVGK
jgi:type IV pilus assembly protein PilN